MKVAPLYHELSKAQWCAPILVHTGQHYDANMSGHFFEDLQLPHPHYFLGIGGGSHGEQLGQTLMAYERLCREETPDFVVVVGDVNATLSCSLIASRLQVPLGHVEAGLRSRDRGMPEEINRILTDQLSDILWTPSEDADANLKAEGVCPDKISFVGNIMIDSLVFMQPTFEDLNFPDQIGMGGTEYAVVTAHRPSNVDTPESLALIVDTLTQAAERIQLVFPCHPRTIKNLKEFGMEDKVLNNPRIKVLEPQGYKEFMSLVLNAKVIITDSGGIQEEATYMNIPCLTMRETTERPITVDQGTNVVTPPSQLPESVLTALDQVLSGDWKDGHCPPLWDGKTAGRIRQDLEKILL